MNLKRILVLRRKFLTSKFQIKMIFKRQEHSENGNKTIKGNEEADDPLGKGHCLPEEPTTCCMSGCPNCVWVQYAEKVSEYFQDSGERAKEIINERIQDGNMRAFLLMELRALSSRKKT